MAQENKETICPESTIESANRRSFIRKAAAVTAVVGVGGILLEKTESILPESSADSANGTTVTTDTYCSNQVGNLAVFDEKSSITGACRTSRPALLRGSILNHPILDIHNSALCGNPHGSPTCCCCPVYTGIGIRAVSVGNAIEGHSCLRAGVVGSSALLCGVFGRSAGEGVFAGVTGYSHGKASGVQGISHCGAGVVGGSCQGVGVWADAECCVAICAITSNPIIGRFRSKGNCPDQTASIQISSGFGVGCPTSWCIGVGGPGNNHGVSKGQFFLFQSFPNEHRKPTVVVNTCGMVGIGTVAPNTTFQVNGGFSVGTKVESSDYSMSSSDFVILAKASSKSITITLPPASNTGQMINIKKVDSTANKVSVQRQGTDTIEGATSKSLPSQYDGLTLVAGGDGVWYAISSST